MLFAHCFDLANQKFSSFLCILSILEMRRHHRRSKVPITYSVMHDTATEYLELVLGKLRDLLVVGTILRVAECDNAGNLVFDGC